MRLGAISDKTLILNLETAVHAERKCLTEVLHLLKEVERRRLFSSLGYKSIFEFAVKRLGYAEDQAYRRISAMRLLKELPEIEEQLTNGEISLTHLGLAQKLFREEKKAKCKELANATKLSVINAISNKSVREAERLTLSMSSVPEKMTPDRMRAVSVESVALKFNAKPELMKKIEQMKGLLAHKNPNLTLGELFEFLCDLGLKEFDPAQKGLSRVKRNESALGGEEQKFAAPSKLCVKQKEDGTMLEAQEMPQAELVPQAEARVKAKVKEQEQAREQDRAQGQVRNQVQKQEQDRDKRQDQNQNPPREAPLASAQKISQAHVRREIFKRAQNQCENCRSRYALEIDHILPKALGGDSYENNLRVLCRSCNQRAAIEKLGQKKMDRFIN